MNSVTLRQWQDSDLEPYVAMNQDPEVMRYFPSRLTREQSQEAMERHRGLIDTKGWGFWAVDVDGCFAGFTGLAVPRYETPFTPCVEIAWRLRPEYWGKSIAYQAALQALDYGFNKLELPEIVSFTAAINLRSRRLMERLGFVRDFDGDFDHPLVPKDHEVCRHVLYRKRAK